MDQKFFRVPFAQSGDRQTVPDALQSSGVVSFPSGWGGDYAKDPTVDANAKPVEREAMNAILYAITNAVRQYQVFGFPEYITPADNNGSVFAYSSGAVVRYRQSAALAFKSYVSVDDNNTSVPGTDETKWQEFIYRESSTDEAADPTNETTQITPRRLHPVIDAAIEQFQLIINPQLVPVGFGGIWFTDTPPDGWLEANGQAFDIEKYPKLAQKFPSGRVPDARGRFARGWSHGSATDPDSEREICSTQEDAMQEIKGEFVIDDWGWADGKLFKIVRGGSSGWDSQGGGLVVEFNSSNVARTSIETRPKNIAVMYIIKTDLAETEPSIPTPTAIVITPRSSNINAGSSLQFLASVLPVEFHDNYPVDWAVSDASLGNISSSGNYTASAGMTGVQTIIASISTGLTALVTINQYVYLTNISVANIPNISVGDNYNLAITFSPAGYTEPVDYASSDAQIASIGAGMITGVSPGTVTISATGRYSGVTVSRQVTVTPKVIVEKYLQINERLSEIAAAGAAAQAAARNNLGLGGLATKDGLTAADVSAVPQASASLGTENLNTVISLGRKFQALTSNATLARNYPVALAGMLDVIKTTDAGIRQTFYPYNTTDVYHRYCVDVGANPIVFSAWGKSGGDFLEKPQNLADVPNKPTARENLGVGYTISTAAPPTSASGYAQGHIWYQVGES
ncbi:tail fiber protein [Pectobacterium quasiaquaticum]|uniref:Tail fiber protein n=1 Tax=Pectobacterium quasiaquaticum TaxID=2774015 RepID=A0A9Q2IBI1_9GAMM|nr:tail fiber protein [Pectobacterium quasiaquaticum]URG50637.1 tail fiber protein [Pectobacterium quasiaquaticum]